MTVASPPVAAAPRGPEPLHGEAGADADDAFAWVATVDHKRIGIMYLLTALFFFGAGVESSVSLPALSFAAVFVAAALCSSGGVSLACEESRDSRSPGMRA